MSVPVPNTVPSSAADAHGEDTTIASQVVSEASGVPAPPDTQSAEDINMEAGDDELSDDEDEDDKPMQPDGVGRLWPARPDVIEEKWRQLYKFIKKSWWTDDIGDFKGISTMKVVNDEIYKECELIFDDYISDVEGLVKLCEENNIPSDRMMDELKAIAGASEHQSRSKALDRFRLDMLFPTETLLAQIEAIRREADKLTQMRAHVEKDPSVKAKLQAKELEMLNHMALFVTVLSNKGIQPIMIASPNTLSEFLRPFQANPELEKKFSETISWIFEPTRSKGKLGKRLVSK